MFQRFTDEARRVVVGAQEVSRLLHHEYPGAADLLLGPCHDGPVEPDTGQVLAAGGVTRVGPAHVLLGLLQVRDSRAVDVLRALGADLLRLTQAAGQVAIRIEDAAAAPGRSAIPTQGSREQPPAAIGASIAEDSCMRVMDPEQRLSADQSAGTPRRATTTCSTSS